MNNNVITVQHACFSILDHDKIALFVEALVPCKCRCTDMVLLSTVFACLIWVSLRATRKQKTRVYLLSVDN